MGSVSRRRSATRVYPLHHFGDPAQPERGEGCAQQRLLDDRDLVLTLVLWLVRLQLLGRELQTIKQLVDDPDL